MIRLCELRPQFLKEMYNHDNEGLRMSMWWIVVNVYRHSSYQASDFDDSSLKQSECFSPISNASCPDEVRICVYIYNYTADSLPVDPGYGVDEVLSRGGGGGVLRFGSDGGVPLKPPNQYLSLRVILAEKGTYY